MSLQTSCARCGTGLPPDARFCENCGTAVAPAESPKAVVEQPPLPRSDAASGISGGRRRRYGALVLAGLALAAFWVVLHVNRSATDAVQPPLSPSAVAETGSGSQAANESGQCAQETVLFDNWNTAACVTSDTAEFDLRETAVVTAIDLWSNHAGLTVSLLGPSGPAAPPLTVQGGGCDPYQSQWCEQKFIVNRRLAGGHYTVQASQPSLCRNESSGGGFVRLHGCLPVH